MRHKPTHDEAEREAERMRRLNGRREEIEREVDRLEAVFRELPKAITTNDE